MFYYKFNFKTFVVNNNSVVFVPIRDIKYYFQGLIPASGDPLKPFKAAIMALHEMDDSTFHTDENNSELLINAKGLWNLAIMFPIGLSNRDELYKLIEYMIEKGVRSSSHLSNEKNIHNDDSDHTHEEGECKIEDGPRVPVNCSTEELEDTKALLDIDLYQKTYGNPLSAPIRFSEVRNHPEKDQIMHKIKRFSHYLQHEIKEGNIRFGRIEDISTRGYAVSMGDILLPVDTVAYIIMKHLKPFYELTYNKNDRSDVIWLTKIMKVLLFEKSQTQVYSENLGLESRPYFKKPINMIVRTSDDTWKEITKHSLLHYLNPEQNKFLYDFEKIVKHVSTMSKTETNRPCSRSTFIAKWSEVMKRKYDIAFSDDKSEMLKEFKDVEIEPIPKINYQPLVMAFMRNEDDHRMGLAAARNLQQEIE